MTTASAHELIDQCLEKILPSIVSSQFGDATFELKRRDADNVYDAWMSGIMLAASGIRVVLKLHFNKVTVEQFRGVPPTNGTRLSQKEEALLNDQMKEICNLIIGKLKTTIESAGIDLGVSLPFVTTGFDEYYFTEARGETIQPTVWSLTHRQKGAITCTCEVLLGEEIKKRIIKNLPPVIESTLNADINDEVEFL